MLESLAFALVKTFITFMFQKGLEHMESVRIEGVPKWYYQQTYDHICNSGLARGPQESIERAKSNARFAMQERLANAMRIVAYENYRDRTDPTEKALIERMVNDENLPVFVESAVIYENLEYSEKKSTAYSRVCIPKETLVAYQNERASKLAKTLAVHRRDKAMDEMESEPEMKE